MGVFSNHDDFLLWSDSVIPLLEFDEKLHNKFLFWSDHVKSSYNMRRATHHEALGECIGIVNQAIIKLQMQSEQEPKKETLKVKEIEHPEKITLKWLYQHVGWQFWVGVVSVSGVIFTLGVHSTKLTLVQQIYGLDEVTSKISTNIPSNKADALEKKSTGNTTIAKDDRKEKGAINVRFLDGFSFVNLSYDTVLSAQDAPKIVAVYGTREKAEESLSKNVVSEVHSQMERLSIADARKNRNALEKSIVEATKSSQLKTFIKIASFEILAID